MAEKRLYFGIGEEPLETFVPEDDLSPEALEEHHTAIEDARAEAIRKAANYSVQLEHNA